MTNCEEQTYSPYTSFGSLMPLTEPTTSFRSTTLLEFPVNTPTTSFEIRNPDSGNQEVLPLPRVSNISRSGTVNTAPSLHIPQVITITYQFQGLKDLEKTNLKNLLVESAGKYIRLTDHESRVWNLIVLNPSSSIAQLRLGCRPHAIKLQFKGNLE